MCSFTSAAAASATSTAQLSSESHRRASAFPPGLSEFRVSSLMGIFLPVRTLKVSQFRFELGKRNKTPRRRAGCDGAFGLQSFFCPDQCCISTDYAPAEPVRSKLQQHCEAIRMELDIS